MFQLLYLRFDTLLTEEEMLLKTIMKLSAPVPSREFGIQYGWKRGGKGGLTQAGEPKKQAHP